MTAVSQDLPATCSRYRRLIRTQARAHSRQPAQASDQKRLHFSLNYVVATPENNPYIQEVDSKELKFRSFLEDKAVQSSLARDCNLPLHQVSSLVTVAIHIFERPAEKAEPTELPASAPELYVFRGASPEGRRENIVEFLDRVWKPWIDAKLLTRLELRRLDPKAEKAVDNWIQNNGPLPENVRLPTKKEVIDEVIASHLLSKASSVKLSRIAASRQLRGLTASGPR